MRGSDKTRGHNSFTIHEVDYLHLMYRNQVIKPKTKDRNHFDHHIVLFPTFYMRRLQGFCKNCTNCLYIKMINRFKKSSLI